MHWLCHDKPLNSSTWTIGCSPEIKVPARTCTSAISLVQLQESKELGQKVFVEFFDIGGHRKYKLTRDLFYSQHDGGRHARTGLLNVVGFQACC